jgi:hypothetical protein
LKNSIEVKVLLVSSAITCPGPGLWQVFGSLEPHLLLTSIAMNSNKGYEHASGAAFCPERQSSVAEKEALISKPGWIEI